MKNENETKCPHGWTTPGECWTCHENGLKRKAFRADTAAAMLPTLYPMFGELGPEFVATMAVRHADALLAELEK
jgi:hypothetical protein